MRDLLASQYRGRVSLWLAAAVLIALVLVPSRGSPTRVAIRVHCDGSACDLAEALAVDVWSEGRGDTLDVVVPEPALVALADAGVAYEVIVPDIDASAREESARIRAARLAARPGEDWFAEYRDFTEITQHLGELVELAPDRVSLHKIGGSIEGRPLLALQIGHGGTKMLVNGTQHAREWIATMVSTCVADRLVRDYDRDPAIKAFVDSTELWVVPVVNPDGYEFSWGSNRYWRKNRRARHGVDLNRNFSTAWGGSGSSNRESSETYRGPTPFSEPETAALRDLALRERFALHVDFHAYGQLLLYPWGYTHKPSDDDARFRAIGDRMATALYAQHETPYRLMASSELYLAAGTMTDWMYGDAKALSYTIELRPKGRGGFVLPPEQIRPTCDEGLAAVLELGKSAR